MEDNLFVSLLKTLNRRELARFAELVGSPFFNKQPDCLAYITLLQTNYPDFDLQPTHIFSKVYPDIKTFKFAKIHHLNSKMVQLLTIFFTF